MFVATTVTVFILLQLQSSPIHAKPSQVQMPSQCQDSNYCMTKSADYPLEEVEAILSKLRLRAVRVESNDQIGNRDGEDDVESICESNPKIDPIYEIVDQQGDVRFVAQMDETFVQTIKIVECQNPGRLTHAKDVIKDYELALFNVTCAETRLDHKFLVLSHDRRHLELASPAGGLPVCCSCRYSELNP